MDTPHVQAANSAYLLKAVAILAMVFGVATLFSGGNVLFGSDEARELAGDYVPFVVGFNFAAGFFYVIAAIGIWLGRSWAFSLSVLIAAATAIAAVAFAIQVTQSGAFEMRTVGALALRIGFWAAIAMVVYRKARRP